MNWEQCNSDLIIFQTSLTDHHTAMADPPRYQTTPANPFSPAKLSSPVSGVPPPQISPSLPPLSVQRVFSPLSPNLVIRSYRPFRFV